VAIDEQEWREDGYPALSFESRSDGMVECHLCPRRCVMSESEYGFCSVRVNRGGRLLTLNYGKAVPMTEETIETQGVFHFGPGARVLSMGNVGCVMKCKCCHNWPVSQAEYAKDGVLRRYTPEKVVEEAIHRGIEIISWTYSDPVAWHEFVLDTALLAREHGLINLYESSLFISEKGAIELADVIDVFSVSLKSTDPGFYSRLTSGWLEPSLDAVEAVFKRGCHVEISNLVITDGNDSAEETRDVALWVVENLGADVPLHYVRFHPDYEYVHVGSTPIERLERAREQARDIGVHYCYVGNVFGHEGANSYCHRCGALLVERFGVLGRAVGLSRDRWTGNRCQACGTSVPFVTPLALTDRSRPAGVLPTHHQGYLHRWHGSSTAVHVEARNESRLVQPVVVRHCDAAGNELDTDVVLVEAASEKRFIVSKSNQRDVGMSLEHPEAIGVRVLDVFDRSHFPLEIDRKHVESGDAG
jgi:pyruvate formate lyase activating enzyme